jgi:hypothetical protein
MTWQDIFNGSFELLGAPFIFLSVIKLYKDKIVAGVSWLHAGFFATWGYWNLYYYPHLDQWASFAGGVLIVIINTIWLCQLIYYEKFPGGRI